MNAQHTAYPTWTQSDGDTLVVVQPRLGQQALRKGCHRRYGLFSCEVPGVSLMIAFLAISVRICLEYLLRGVRHEFRHLEVA